MKYLENFADERFNGYCIYCGGSNETREHVPPKIFLDKPFPNELHIVEACRQCNSSFSLDEVFAACLIEYMVYPTNDINKIGRTSIRKALEHSPALWHRLCNIKSNANAQHILNCYSYRLERIIKKVALGHVLYELNLTLYDMAPTIAINTSANFNSNEREAFENIYGNELTIWPEVGSRMMHRLLVPSADFQNGWVIVQENRYRYSVKQEYAVEVRMVLSEYLFCSVIWDGS